MCAMPTCSEITRGPGFYESGNTSRDAAIALMPVDA
jgi:hypothetical protein